MDLLIPDIAVVEKIFRSVVVYGFLLVALRLAGKRLLGQLTAFDLVVLLIIGNVLQHVIHANLDRESMSMRELRAALREEGVATMSEVRYAILEEDGHVSVIHRRSVPA